MAGLRLPCGAGLGAIHRRIPVVHPVIRLLRLRLVCLFPRSETGLSRIALMESTLSHGWRRGSNIRCSQDGVEGRSDGDIRPLFGLSGIDRIDV